ncbi:MAG TPA: family 20 glycosylhydrolase, partial [Pseudomonadales bacterium]|nr:family 20 glycosylhydrolase [Pseudomonadales bacterium]
EAFQLQVTYGLPADDRVLITIVDARGGQQDEYSLVSNTRGVTLSASSEPGVFYGLATFAQILRQSGPSIPCFRITDRPDFQSRGVMLDISRCKVPTMETLRQLIDDLAALKYNQVQLYTEHTFAFENHRVVWADASPTTASDIVELGGWCRDRYIELIPNLNSFGHFERWLRHPEYHSYAECPDGFTHPFSGGRVEFGSTLQPNRQSLALLSELYDEYLPLFESSQFNVGGDEPWELGQGASKRECERRGTTAVYVDFMSRIQKLVEARHHTMMFWSDIVLREPECLNVLSRELIALNWGYEGNHPFKKECAQVAAAGIPFYVCPGTSSWNTLTGRTANVQANLANAARNGKATGALGYLVTDWGDGGHHQYLPISYQGFLLGACHAWNHRGTAKIDVGDGVDRAFFDRENANAGDILVRLGRALELVPSKIRNATLFNRLLFWSMQHEPTAADRVTAAQLGDCDDELAAIRGSLTTIQGRDASLVRAELENAVDLARHGIHRLQCHRKLRKDRATLREELAIAIGRHESLWLARNRPGGLHESSARLRQSLADLT